MGGRSGPGGPSQILERKCKGQCHAPGVVIFRSSLRVSYPTHKHICKIIHRTPLHFFFLNQDLSFHFVSQLDCEFLKCTDSVTLFCFFHIKSASSHRSESTVFEARQPVLKNSSTISYVTLNTLDSVASTSYL